MCYVCVCIRGNVENILEHIHLLWEVETEQTVEAAKLGLSGEVQPHDLAQIPVRNVRYILSHATLKVSQ